MKKILSALILVSFLTVLLAPMLVMGDEIELTGKCTMGRAVKVGTVDCGAKGATVDAVVNPDKAICCLLNTVYNIADWIFVVLVGVAVIFVVWGGLQIVTAGGAAEKVETGRNYIMYAIIGLVIALLAKVIPGIVKLVVGV